jgi:adenylate cyclase
VLDLLVADQLLVPSPKRYTQRDVAEITGIPLELIRRFWRALGFPDVALDDRMFTDLDVEALQVLRSLVDLGVADLDTALQLARVVGSSMARIAEAEVSPALRGMIGGAGAADATDAADRFARVADQWLSAVGQLLEFVWRRHLQVAVRRSMLLRTRGETGSLPVLAVGFADMVGFTMLSQQLSEQELAAVVSRFEEVAHDTVTRGGGRVVKMIGDEAMFVTESVVDAARIGLSLAETYADDELLSDVRVALAAGPVLVQDGDFYGPVVNLASRVVVMAAPGSVLVTDEFKRALEPGGGDAAGGDAAGAGTTPADAPRGRDQAERVVAQDEFVFRALRPRQVRDLGRVQLWVLRRRGDEPVTIERRIGRRFERLTDVIQDLDDLRARGERLIAGPRAGGNAEAAAPSRARSAKRGDAEGAQRE